MTEITIIDLVLAAIGGVLIGLSAITLLAMNGRIAGISGIVGGIIRPDHSGDMGWRVAFVGGLLLGPLVTYIITQRPVEIAVAASTPTLIIAGLLVGLGTAIGSGCTSGHGVCGIARFSPRSLAATGIFMGIATLTVFVSRHMMGAG